MSHVEVLNSTTWLMFEYVKFMGEETVSRFPDSTCYEPWLYDVYDGFQSFIYLIWERNPQKMCSQIFMKSMPISNSLKRNILFSPLFLTRFRKDPQVWWIEAYEEIRMNSKYNEWKFRKLFTYHLLKISDPKWEIHLQRRSELKFTRLCLSSMHRSRVP